MFNFFRSLFGYATSNPRETFPSYQAPTPKKVIHTVYVKDPKAKFVFVGVTDKHVKQYLEDPSKISSNFSYCISEGIYNSIGVTFERKNSNPGECKFSSHGWI